MASNNTYKSYSDQWGDDINVVAQIAKMVGQFLAIVIAPLACAMVVTHFQGHITDHASFAWRIALAAITGKVLLDLSFLYSLRLYNREFTVNRELNRGSVATWFKWTGFATAVAIATAVAVTFSDVTPLQAAEQYISYLSF